MKLNAAIVVILIGVAITSSCTTATKQQMLPSKTATAKSGAAEPAAPVKSSTEAPPGAPIPNVELTPDLFHDLLLAEIATQRGHLKVATELYDKWAKSTRDPRLAEHAARLAVYAQDSVHALDAAKLWVDTDPNNMEARQILAVLLIRQGHTDAALSHMEKVLALSDRTGESGFLVIAGLLEREQDKRAALEAMNRFVALRPNDPNALYAYSFLAARTGEYKTANEAIAQAIKLKPDWVEAKVQEARIFKLQGQDDIALKKMRETVDGHPENQELRITFARMLVEEERLEEALEQFQDIAKQQPDNQDVLFALGFLTMQLEKFDEAENYFSKLIEMGHREMEAAYYLGRIAEVKQDFNKALEWYTSVGTGEHYLNAQIRVAVLIAKQGDIQSAIAHLRALKSDEIGEGQALRLYLVEGEILHDANRYQEAFDLYTQALTEIPDNTDLLYARSMVAEQLDRLDVTESDLKKILEREPDNAEVLNALGYTLADRTTRYQEALTYIEKALQLRPNDFFILDSMGWVQYRLGNYDDAEKYLRRAMEKKMDAEVAAHLGEVLWVMGKQKEASEVWEKALATAPDGKKNQLLKDVMLKFSADKR